jgi:hypothetical protein
MNFFIKKYIQVYNTQFLNMVGFVEDTLQVSISKIFFSSSLTLWQDKLERLSLESFFSDQTNALRVR